MKSTELQRATWNKATTAKYIREMLNNKRPWSNKKYNERLKRLEFWEDECERLSNIK